MTLTFADKGRTVRVPRGTAVVLRLDSTYWGIAPSSNPQVVAGTTPVVKTDPRRMTPPGTGAGTVIEQFRTLATGTARLSAVRTSCGEALRCSPAQGAFAVTIVVT